MRAGKAGERQAGREADPSDAGPAPLPPGTDGTAATRSGSAAALVEWFGAEWGRVGGYGACVVRGPCRAVACAGLP